MCVAQGQFLEEWKVKISVIGAGYVGLVTGGCLAGLGHEVVCTDSDAEKLKVLESGQAADLRAWARRGD